VFQAGDRAAYDAEQEESSCLKFTDGTRQAYQTLFGAGEEEMPLYAAIGAVAHTSAMFAPGYVLAGFKVERPAGHLEVGDDLNTQARIEEVQTTKSGKTLIKAAIDVRNPRAGWGAKGQVTKIKSDPAAAPAEPPKLAKVSG
jgi:hypothetical protein